MDLSQKESHLKFDKRVSDRLIRQGNLTTDELQKQLKALPDLEKEAEVLAPYDEEEEAGGLAFVAG